METIELEKKILGSLLLYNDLRFEESFNKLRPEMFTDEKNGFVFKAIKTISESEKQIDLVTITQELRRQEAFEKVGISYIPTLTNKVTTSVNFDEYVFTLAEAFLRRRMINISEGLVKVAHNENKDVFEGINTFVKQAEELITDDVMNTDEDLNKTIDEVFEIVTDPTIEDGSFLSSYVHCVDDMLGGWERGGLHIVGGRPGMGKTTSILSVINKMSILNNVKGAFFSLEMGNKQNIKKFFAITSGVHTWKIMKRELNQTEKDKVFKTAGKLKEGNLQIFDKIFSIDGIISKCRALHLKGQLEYVVIDYLQLIQGNREKNSNREQEISGISRRLKMLAMALDIPVIALSQLNRGVETRGGAKIPSLSDLRESGSLEQDASTVLMCYRPSKYEIQGEDGKDLTNLAIWICCKNRTGKTGNIEFFYREELNQEWADLSESNNNFIEEKKDDFFPTSITQTSNNF
jgi:replicative DNA helicase